MAINSPGPKTCRLSNVDIIRLLKINAIEKMPDRAQVLSAGGNVQILIETTFGRTNRKDSLTGFTD
jgi:hypothetical protein